MAKGTIIFLNGVSSSGNTTLTHVLQTKLHRPFYHIAHDTFNQMASKSHRSVNFWGVTNTAISAMHHTIALFSNLGLDVIVDHVILDIPEEQTWLRECIQLLHSHPVLFVRLECPIEELERRERQRGDRNEGQAQAQIDRIHGHGIYDLTVDTYQQTTDDCAEMIIAAMKQPNDFSAFNILYQRWFKE